MKKYFTLNNSLLIVFLFVITSFSFPFIEKAKADENISNPNTYITNGSVDTIAVGADGTTYIGGNFSMVGPYTGGGVALDTTTGIYGSALPKVDGSIYIVVPDGSGGWYIGGRLH